MGFFSNLFGGGRERPEIRVPTAQELLSESTGFLRGQFPQFAQARETGLEALTAQGFAPQVGIPAVDWGAFGPTTFEQGIATSAFQPLIEQARRQALQIGSLAGIPSAAPAHFGRAIAPAMLNIGQFLAGQQQQRGLTEQQRLMQQALSTEQARQFQLGTAIGQDPFQEIMAGAGLGQQQAALQAQEQLARWQAEQAGMGGGAGLTSLLGAGLGAALAIPTGGLSIPMGAALGGAAGGSLGTLFGGGPSPIGFQDVALMSMLGGLGGGGGAGIGAGQAAQNIFGMEQFGPAIGRTVPVGGF